MDPFPKLLLKNFFNFNFFKRQGLSAKGIDFNPFL
jgi:hypothetical protein